MAKSRKMEEEEYEKEKEEGRESKDGKEFIFNETVSIEDSDKAINQSQKGYEEERQEGED